MGQGECADLNGDVFSWAQFTNTAYSIPNVEKCAHTCEELDTTGQVGIGFWDNILCRCYFDGNAPAEPHEAASFGQHVGSGPIGGVSAGDHWHCYRRIVSLQHFGPRNNLPFANLFSIVLCPQSAGTVDPTARPTAGPVARPTQITSGPVEEPAQETGTGSPSISPTPLPSKTPLTASEVANLPVTGKPTDPPTLEPTPAPSESPTEVSIKRSQFSPSI